MRMILYILILSLLFFAPVERLDVAKLQPVQTVAVRVVEEQLQIITDTDVQGIGKTIAEAVANLEQNTPGVIYLDTAQYLLLTEDALEEISQLKDYLHESVFVSKWDGEGGVSEAAKYLSVRKDLPQIGHMKTFVEKS